MKRIAIIFFAIIFGLLLRSQLAHAQTIYKWVDEKGTTHYSEDPNAVPEKYKNKAQKKDIDEFPPVLSYKPNVPQSDNRTQGPKSYYDAHPEEKIPDQLAAERARLMEEYKSARTSAEKDRLLKMMGIENSQNSKSSPPPKPPPPPLPKRPPPPPPQSSYVIDLGGGLVLDPQTGRVMDKF